jgi:hypothetical protein
MVESNVSDEAASTVPPLITAGSTKLKSSVWADFEYKAGEGRAAAMATCRWCDKTLCAGGRNGSSHLRRHSKRCRERWRQQTTAPAAAGPSLGDQEAFYLVNGLNIQQLFDELDSTDLVHIDPASDDAHFLPNFVFILLFILMFSSLHMQTCRALSLSSLQRILHLGGSSKRQEKGKYPSRVLLLSFASDPYPSSVLTIGRVAKFGQCQIRQYFLNFGDLTEFDQTLSNFAENYFGCKKSTCFM